MSLLARSRSSAGYSAHTGVVDCFVAVVEEALARDKLFPLRNLQPYHSHTLSEHSHAARTLNEVDDNHFPSNHTDAMAPKPEKKRESLHFTCCQAGNNIEKS